MVEPLEAEPAVRDSEEASIGPWPRPFSEMVRNPSGLGVFGWILLSIVPFVWPFSLYVLLRYATGHRAPGSRGLFPADTRLGHQVHCPSLLGVAVAWVIGLFTGVGYLLAFYMSYRYLTGNRAASLTDRLAQLDEARNSGLITAEEREAKRAAMLHIDEIAGRGSADQVAVGDQSREEDSPAEAERTAVLGDVLGQHLFEETRIKTDWKRRGFGKLREAELVKAYELGIADGATLAQELYAQHPDRLKWTVTAVGAGRRGSEVVPEITTMKLNRSDYMSFEEFIAACEVYGAGYTAGYMTLTFRRLAPST